MTLCYCLVGTLGKQPTGFTIDKQTLGNCFDIIILFYYYDGYVEPTVLKVELMLAQIKA